MAKFPKMESLQRQNLLINSDFKSGIINQKGQSSYNTIYQYGIDMWYMISNGTLKLNNNSITVSSDLKFFFDKQLPNDNYTFTVSVSGTIYKYTFVGFNGTSKTTNLNVKGKTLGVEMISNYIVLYMNGNTFDIEFIKLEKGSSYTGMPAWNYTLELLKCQKYLLVVKPLFSSSTYFKSQSGPRTSRIVIQVPTPVQMNKKPIIVGTVTAKHRCFTNAEYWVEVTNPEIDSVSTTHIDIIFSHEGLGRNITGEVWIDSPLVLDAYNY